MPADFLRTGTFAELWAVLISVLFGTPQPLNNLQMIIICVGTDIFAAMSLVYEPPEADLLARPPRDPRKDRLANWRLLCHAYFFVGVPVTLVSMVAAFYWGFQRHGFPWGQTVFAYENPNTTPAYQEITYVAQSLYFFNLVIFQLFNAQSTRNCRLSIFQQPPWRNPRLLCAAPISIGILVLFSYVPFFQNVFGDRGVPVYGWLLPIAYGLGFVCLDELRKLTVRTKPNSFVAWLAW